MTEVDTETQPAPQFVRVAQMAADTQTLDYLPIKTVQDYLEEAGVEVGDGRVITLNGEQVGPYAAVEPDSQIVVTGKVANG